MVYMDRFFTSGPLVQELQRHKIYTVGSIKESAGFPLQLSGNALKKVVTQLVRQTRLISMFLMIEASYHLLATLFPWKPGPCIEGNRVVR